MKDNGIPWGFFSASFCEVEDALVSVASVDFLGPRFVGFVIVFFL